MTTRWISHDGEDALAAASRMRRAYERRSRTIAAVFVAVELFIALFGAAALEGVNVLRAYAAGESFWSKAEKSAAIALDHYALRGRESDYVKFRAAVATVEGDHRAREALSGERPSFAASAAGFAAGGNDRSDTGGLVAGYVLFHNWPPFAAAVGDWKQGEVLVRQLALFGAQLHARGALSPAQTVRAVDRIDALDAALSGNEMRYAAHMGEASRSAMLATLILFVLLSAAACAGGIFLTRRVLKAGMRAEQRVLTTEQRVRDFAELGTDFFCEFDRDWCVTFAASRAETNIALSGLSFADILRREKLQGISSDAGADWHRGFRGRQVDQAAADGAHTSWSVSGMPLHDRHGAFDGFRLIATDISAMIRTQNDLVAARDEARQANRAKSAFLANMSHELRTPLNAILGFSELIERQVLGDLGNPRYAGYAHDIRTSGVHLLAIINDLLDHSRIEAGQLMMHAEPFDVAFAIEGVRLLCQERADKLDVTLAVEAQDGLPLLLGDELRFKQVLINIVTNAIKFSPGRAVTVIARRDGESLHLEVVDTGIGMDAAGIAQALRPFGQVDSGLNRKYEGTGLGVPLAKSLVELQGGAFALASAPGAGTRVTIALPFRRADAAPPLAMAG